MTETPKQSDQMPEEAPAEQVPDDVPEAGEGAARESAQAHAKRAGQDQEEIGYRENAEEDAYRRGERG
ncbi:hypothetical protein [Conexibacter arvalis]|uniref:Uncharacterized protein n=1 Tax=Conexibacter arvalis TaxID=912552 RepID=A0A840II09_9ACTN|nr:hypothetical protein [Conexibacter arvalis]MBB4663600.1 hypothetical protein [Conexibacter arvalis]